MPTIHHRKLPDVSTALSGSGPITDEVGFPSEKLFVWYHHTDQEWRDERAHAHLEADECFIVLQGSITVEVDGEETTIGPREFCCFPVGVFHRIVRVSAPVEGFAIKSPLVDDKIDG